MGTNSAVDEEDAEQRAMTAAEQELIDLFDEPACYVNWFRIQGFADETVRFNFGECATAEYTAHRGSYSMQLLTARRLHEILGRVIEVAVKQSEAMADAKKKMN